MKSEGSFWDGCWGLTVDFTECWNSAGVNSALESDTWYMWSNQHRPTKDAIDVHTQPLSGYPCHILVLVSRNLLCGVATLFWVARPDVSAWPLLFWHYFECHKFSEAGRKVLHPGPKNRILITDLYSFLSTLLSDFSIDPLKVTQHNAVKKNALWIYHYM